MNHLIAFETKMVVCNISCLISSNIEKKNAELRAKRHIAGTIPL
jgi:hypothetical protein